jgi:predicted O-methyltransferase YrrM
MKSFDLTAAPTADPLAVYRYRDGLYAVDLLTAALVYLDFFSWLAAHPSSDQEICRGLELAPRPADVMLTLFTASGFIRRQPGHLEVTEVGREFLVKDSPWFMGPYYASLKDRPLTQDFLRVLRTNQPANWGSFKGEKDWSHAMETEEFARHFTAAMDCRGVYLARALAQKLDLKNHHRLLDIAGGSGIYACSLAAHFPHLRGMVFERPPVDKIVRSMVSQRGFADRVEVAAGDMFQDPLPSGCDVHLFSNVLHDWDFPQVSALLKNSFASLPSGGLLVIHDAHINADKSGPLPVAQYSSLLMHSTEGKCYSLAEMSGLLAEIGFAGIQFAETAVDRSALQAVKP